MTTKIALTNIADTALATLTGPKITTIVYPGTETATDTAGGETINLTGNGFQSGCSVLVGSTAASVVTFISTTQISFVAPAMSANTYVIYVINPDGGTAISIPGISYSGTPNWTTAAGSLGTAYETGSISTTLAATGDIPITYVLASGTLPTGSTLSTGGSLSGTAPATASITTYNFTITAKDAQNQTTNRAFSLTINPDVVSWSSPASLATYSVFKDVAIANVTMSATSAAGGSVTYTADTLPTGLSITGANIAGTPTVAASTTTVLTATATSTRTATRTINWVVSVANDTYWKNTTLLLNGETTVTPFISDASTNSFGLTINGDTKPVLFNPYQGDGYYSNYFNGSTDYLSIANATALQLSSNQFTVEGWFYFVTSGVDNYIVTQTSGSPDANVNWLIRVTSTNKLRFLIMTSGGAVYFDGTTTVTANTWHHFASTCDGTGNNANMRSWLDGAYQGGTTVTASSINTNAGTTQIGSWSYNSAYSTGYISNIRILKGTALYTGTSNIVVPTTPLTAIANTSLLVCQSNRFVDKSTNNFTLTVGGSPQISPAIPFTQNSSYSTYGSAYFDGTGDYLNAGSNTVLNFSGDFTVEMWVYGNTADWNSGDAGGNTCLVDTRNQSNSTENSRLFLGIQNSISAPYFYNAGTNTQTSSSITVKVGVWNHIAYSRSGSTIKIFVNGIQGASFTDSTSFSASRWVIGTGASQAGGSNNRAGIQGYISDHRVVKGTAVYTTAFTPPTAPLTAIANTSLLTLQYNGGANNYGIVDNSPFNNIITRAGNATQGTFSPYSVTGWSNFFNGTTDYFTVPATSTAFGANPWTIEGWFYITSLSSACVLVDTRNSSAGNNGVQMSVLADGSLYWFEGSASSIIVLGTGTITTNRWYHIAYVRSSTATNGCTLYIDGVSRGTGTSNLVHAGYTTYIGRNAAAVQDYMKGYISNLRIVNGSAAYTGAFTPSATPLTAITNTSILTCQSNRFIDNSPNNASLTINGTPSVQAYSPFGSISEATPLSYGTFFNGSTDNLSVPSSTSFVFGTGDFTIEMWVYTTSAATNGGATTDRFLFGGIGNTPSWTFYIQNSTTLLPSFYSPTGSMASSITVTANVWTHLALVRYSGNMAIYVNGNLGGTGANSTNYTASGTQYIAHDTSDGANKFFPGYISNLRVVKGTAVYTAGFTPSTTPLTAITNTVLLTCQSTTIKDNSINALTITASGSPKPYNFNPFGYTAQSATSYTPSLHGGSMYLDGTGDYLDLPAGTTGQLGTAPFTIEFWTYGTDSATSIIFQNTNGTPNWAIIIVSGSLYWQNGYSTSSLYYIATSNLTTNPLVNAWTHIAITRDINNMLKWWINGTGQTALATPDTTNYSSTSAIRIGAGGYGDHTGYLSDIRITKSVAVYTSNFTPPAQTLTSYSTTYPSSLLLNFTNGGVIDQHSSNVLEALGNAQLSTAVKKYNVASIYFDGTGDYLSIPAGQNMTFGTGSFTIEFWCYAPAQGTTRTAFIGTDVSYGANFWTIQLNNTSPAYSSRVQLWCYNMNSAAVAVVGSTTLTASTWYHVAVVRNGTGITIYLNGTSDGTGTSSASLDGGVPQAISIAKNSTDYYTGYIDDLRITKGYARYTSNFTAPTSALITK